jgi:hypothetical protein
MLSGSVSSRENELEVILHETTRESRTIQHSDARRVEVDRSLRGSDVRVTVLRASLITRDVQESE